MNRYAGDLKGPHHPSSSTLAPTGVDGFVQACSHPGTSFKIVSRLHPERVQHTIIIPLVEYPINNGGCPLEFGIGIRILKGKEHLAVARVINIEGIAEAHYSQPWHSDGRIEREFVQAVLPEKGTAGRIECAQAADACSAVDSCLRPHHV